MFESHFASERTGEESSDRDSLVWQTPGSNHAMRAARRYADDDAAYGWLVDEAPAEWKPGAAPEFYCERIHQGPGTKARPGENNVVRFWFRVGDLRRIAQQMSGDDEGSVGMHHVVGVTIADAVGANGLAWLDLPADLDRVKDVDDDKYVVHGLTTGYLLTLRVPDFGANPYPGEARLYRDAIALSADDEVIGTLPARQTDPLSPVDTAAVQVAVEEGAFVDWFAGQVGPPSRDETAVADAQVLYYILHSRSPIHDVELSTLFDILSEDESHTRRVHAIYNRGAGIQDGYLDLVGDLVNYAETLRGDPDKGNARNYLLYLLARAQSDVREYAVQVHDSQDNASPFEIEAVFAKTRDGVHEMPAQASSWFRLDVYDDTDTDSLLDALQRPAWFTVSWYLERDRRPNRVRMPGIGQGEYIEGEQFLGHLDGAQESVSRHNPVCFHHTFSDEDVGVGHTIVCMITWYEKLYGEDRADGYTLKPHVHFIEQPLRILSLEDAMACDIDQAMAPRVGKAIANWRSIAAMYQMVPADIAADLRSQVLVDDATPVHRIAITSSELQRVSDDQPEGYCASFELQPTGDAAGTGGQWYVSSTNADYHSYHRVYGRDVSPRLQPDIGLRDSSNRGKTSFDFRVWLPGDYVIVCVPDDGSDPAVFVHRVFDEYDDQVLLAKRFHDVANNFVDYYTDGVPDDLYSSGGALVQVGNEPLRMYSLRCVYMSKDGKREQKAMYLGTLAEPGAHGSSATGFANGRKWVLFDGTPGQPQSVYRGHYESNGPQGCFDAFELENAYPPGWFLFEWDANTVIARDDQGDLQTTLPTIRSRVIRTNGRDNRDDLIAGAGYGSLGLGLLGMGLVAATGGLGAFAVVGMMCLFASSVGGAVTSLASLDQNMSRNDVDRGLVGVDVAGLAASFLGAAGIVSHINKIAAASRAYTVGNAANMVAVEASTLTKVVSGADAILSGVEFVLATRHDWKEIATLLEQAEGEADNEMIFGQLAASIANMLVSGTMVGLSFGSDLAGVWRRGGRLFGKPGSTVGNEPVPSNWRLDDDSESWLREFCDDDDVDRYIALAQDQPEAARALLNELTLTYHRLGGEQGLRNRPQHIDVLRNLLGSRVADVVGQVDIEGILARLRGQLGRRERRDFEALIHHYAYLSDLSGDPEARIARLLRELDRMTPDLALLRLRIEFLTRLGFSRRRARWVASDVLTALDGREFHRARDLYNSMVFQLSLTSVNAQTLRYFDNIYVQKRHYVFLDIADELQRDGGISSVCRQALGEIRAVFGQGGHRVDRSFDEVVELVHYAHTSGAPGDAQRMILVQYFRVFGFHDGYARALVNQGDYVSRTRPLLLASVADERTLRQVDGYALARVTDAEAATGRGAQARSRPRMTVDRGEQDWELRQLEHDVDFLLPFHNMRTGAIRGLRELDPALVAKLVEMSDREKRAAFILCRRLADAPGHLQGVMDSFVHRRWGGLLSTQARQLEIHEDNQWHKALYGGAGLGSAARRVGPLRGQNYTDIVRTLQNRGFVQTQVWPAGGADRPTVSLWEHTDGSFVRFETSLVPDGSLVTTVQRGGVRMESSGRTPAASLDGRNDLFLASDRGRDELAWSDGTRSRVYRKPSRLPGSRAGAEEDIRRVLASWFYGHPSDFAAEVSDYEVGVFVDLWDDLTRVEIVHDGTAVSEISALERSEPEIVTAPRIDLPVSSIRPVYSGLRPAVAEAVAERRWNHALGDDDVDALNAIYDHLGHERFVENSALWSRCRGLTRLASLRGDSEVFELVVGAAEFRRRSLERLGHAGKIDLAALHDLHLVLGTQRIYDPTTGSSYDRMVLAGFADGAVMIEPLHQLVDIARSNRKKALALLRAAQSRGRGMGGRRATTTRVELFGLIYDRSGHDVFEMHVVRGTFNRDLNEGAIERSVEHYDPRIKTEQGGSPTEVLHEERRVMPPRSSETYANFVHERDAGRVLAAHGYAVEVLPEVHTVAPRPPAKPRPPQLENLSETQRIRALLEHGRAMDKYQTRLDTYRQRSEALAYHQAFLDRHGLRNRRRTARGPNGSAANPDYLVDGVVFDVYDISAGESLENIYSIMHRKTLRGQTRNLILYGTDSKFTPQDLAEQLHQVPVILLEECLFVRGDALYRVAPTKDGKPELITPP